MILLYSIFRKVLYKLSFYHDHAERQLIVESLSIIGNHLSFVNSSKHWTSGGARHFHAQVMK